MSHGEIEVPPLEETRVEILETVEKEDLVLALNSASNKENKHWLQNLWKEIRKEKLKGIPEDKAPIKELDLDKMQVHVNVESRYGDWGSEKFVESKADSLKTLPSFMEDFEVKLDVKKVPTKYKTMLLILDTTNLQALMSTLVKVTLPLADVLRVKNQSFG